MGVYLKRRYNSKEIRGYNEVLNSFKILTFNWNSIGCWLGGFYAGVSYGPYEVIFDT